MVAVLSVLCRFWGYWEPLLISWWGICEKSDEHQEWYHGPWSCGQEKAAYDKFFFSKFLVKTEQEGLVMKRFFRNQWEGEHTEQQLTRTGKEHTHLHFPILQSCKTECNSQQHHGHWMISQVFWLFRDLVALNLEDFTWGFQDMQDLTDFKLSNMRIHQVKL